MKQREWKSAGETESNVHIHRDKATLKMALDCTIKEITKFGWAREKEIKWNWVHINRKGYTCSQNVEIVNSFWAKNLNFFFLSYACFEIVIKFQSIYNYNNKKKQQQH